MLLSGIPLLLKHPLSHCACVTGRAAGRHHLVAHPACARGWRGLGPHTADGAERSRHVRCPPARACTLQLRPRQQRPAGLQPSTWAASSLGIAFSDWTRRSMEATRRCSQRVSCPAWACSRCALAEGPATSWAACLRVAKCNFGGAALVGADLHNERPRLVTLLAVALRSSQGAFDLTPVTERDLGTVARRAQKGC